MFRYNAFIPETTLLLTNLCMALSINTVLTHYHAFTNSRFEALQKRIIHVPSKLQCAMLCNDDESCVVANFGNRDGTMFDCEIMTILSEIDELSRESTRMWQTLGKYKNRRLDF